MDLIEAQIAEIKNLNLIYIFTTDNILKNNSNKYVGAKVLYDKDKVFSLDYKSEHFEEFIKKVLDRYNKEKNRRNIILLGDLTKKLVQDSFFTIADDKQDFKQSFGLLVNRKNNQVKSYEKYLEIVLNNILKILYNYEYTRIDCIDGFNYKYVVDYYCPRKKQLHMLIFVNEDDSLDFRISNIDKNNVNINGTILNKFNNIEINFSEANNDLKGKVIFNTKEKLIKTSIYKEDMPFYFKESEDTLLDEDEQLISFYMGLCDLKDLNNVMKIGEHSYFLSDSNVLVENKDGIFYNNKSCQINIFDDLVIVKHKEKNGISKYNDQIKVALDEEINEFTLKQIEVDNKFYILVEKRTNKNKQNSYSYDVLELDSEKNLFVPFEILNKSKINEELKTFDSAKQYIKKMKVGENHDTV